MNIGNGIKITNKTPTSDVNRCPKKIFLGCANGLSGYPNSTTMDEPKDAIKKIPYCVL